MMNNASSKIMNFIVSESDILVLGAGLYWMYSENTFIP